MYHSFDRINKSQIKVFFNKVFLFKTPAFNLACTKDPKDASYISSLFVFLLCTVYPLVCLGFNPVVHMGHL